MDRRSFLKAFATIAAAPVVASALPQSLGVAQAEASPFPVKPTIGYTNVPSGLLIQWGWVDAGVERADYPVYFPDRPMQVSAVTERPDAIAVLGGVDSPRGFTIKTSADAGRVCWMAIGIGSEQCSIG